MTTDHLIYNLTSVNYVFDLSHETSQMLQACCDTTDLLHISQAVEAELSTKYPVSITMYAPCIMSISISMKDRRDFLQIAFGISDWFDELMDPQSGIDSPFLISKEQILDWLIYHVPLKQVNTPMKRIFPFKLLFDHGNHFAGSMASTPWEAYDEVAEFLYKNPSARQELTDLYYQS